MARTALRFHRAVTLFVLGRRAAVLTCLLVPLAAVGVRDARAAEPVLLDNVGIGEVSGGDMGNARWESKVGDGDFKSMLRKALDSAGLLERATGEGRFALSAVLESIAYPDVGSTVIVRVQYSLADRRTGRELYRESVEAELSLSMWDSLLRSNMKAKLGTDGVKLNIQTVSRKLSEMKISQMEASLSP